VCGAACAQVWVGWSWFCLCTFQCNNANAPRPAPPRLSPRFRGSDPLLLGVLRDVVTEYERVAGVVAGTAGTQLVDSADGSAGSAAFTPALRRVIEAAIPSLGVVAFCKVVPLHTAQPALAAGAPAAPPPALEFAESRAWALPLLAESIGAAPLAFFQSYFVAMALTAEAAARSKSVGERRAKLYRMRSMQLWSLFPSFCVRPCDVPAAFKNMARMLGAAIEDARYPELQATVCAGLAQLIRRSLAAAADAPAAAEAGGSQAAPAAGRARGGSRAAGAKQAGRGAAAAAGGSKPKKAGKRGGDDSGDDDDEEEEDDEDDEDEDVSDDELDSDDDDDGAGAGRRRRGGGKGAASGSDDDDDDDDDSEAEDGLAAPASKLSAAAAACVIPQAEARATLEALRPFAKNFLPLLFAQVRVNP
jgi:hypothetical protein